MNEAELNKRLEELRAQRERLVANVHCVDGAMQECEFWLDNAKAAHKENQ